MSVDASRYDAVRRALRVAAVLRVAARLLPGPVGAGARRAAEQTSERGRAVLRQAIAARRAAW